MPPIYQAPLNPSLMEAAGFVGARAQNEVGSAQARAAINTNQLNQSGEQARQGIQDTAEASGMLRSSRTINDLAQQTAEQANKQQLIDLGVQDTLAGANIDVMQELARQQLQNMEQAQNRSLFDARMGLKWKELSQQPGSTPIDWGQVNSTTGGAVTGPESEYRNY